MSKSCLLATTLFFTAGYAKKFCCIYKTDLSEFERYEVCYKQCIYHNLKVINMFKYINDLRCTEIPAPRFRWYLKRYVTVIKTFDDSFNFQPLLSYGRNTLTWPTLYSATLFCMACLYLTINPFKHQRLVRTYQAISY